MLCSFCCLELWATMGLSHCFNGLTKHCLLRLSCLQLMLGFCCILPSWNSAIVVTKLLDRYHTCGAKACHHEASSDGNSTVDLGRKCKPQLGLDPLAQTSFHPIRRLTMPPPVSTTIIETQLRGAFLALNSKRKSVGASSVDAIVGIPLS